MPIPGCLLSFCLPVLNYQQLEATGTNAPGKIWVGGSRCASQVCRADITCLWSFSWDLATRVMIFVWSSLQIWSVCPSYKPSKTYSSKHNHANTPEKERQVCGRTPEILAFGRLRPESLEFEAGLGYGARSWLKKMKMKIKTVATIVP